MKSKIFTIVYEFLKTKQEKAAVVALEEIIALFESLKKKETHNNPIINQEISSNGEKSISIPELPTASEVKAVVDSIINPAETKQE